MTGTHCPTCNHAFGPLAGVPAGPREPFTADVTCPECARVIPRGSLLLVGSSRLQGVGTPTIEARVLMMVGSVGMLLLVGGRLLGRVEAWQASGPRSGLLLLLGAAGTVTDALCVALLIGVIVWQWRRWSPRSGDDRRADVSWERQWLVTPGQVEIFDRSGGPRVRRLGSGADGARALKREDVRTVWSEDPNTGSSRLPHSAKRPVRLVLERAGTARFLTHPLTHRAVIVLDAGADAAPDVGDRLADSVHSIVTGRAAGVRDGTVSLRGRPDACRRWPKGAHARLMLVISLAVLVGLPLWVFASIMLASEMVGLPLAVVMPVLGALLGLGTLGLHGLLTRDLRRRWRGEAHWTVGADGVRVSTQRHEGPARSPAEMLVQSSTIGDLTIGTELDRPRIRLLDRGGAEICGLTPDTLPADGLEATRRCLLVALGLPPA